MNIYNEVFESEFGIEEDEKERMELVGLVQRADFVNKNKRFYPKEVLTAAVTRFKQKLKRSFSQLDHPDMKGKLRDTSHLIKDLYWDDNDLYARILVLDTVPGRTLREIIRAGGRPGLSSRGNGKSTKVRMNGQEVERISSGFELTGIDFVTSPSVPDAGVKQVIREAHEDQTLIRIRQKLQKLAGIPITECGDCSYILEQENDCVCFKCGHQQTSDKPCRETTCDKCGGMMKDTAAIKPPSMKPKEQENAYRCTCADCGFTFSHLERCIDVDCPRCHGPVKSAAPVPVSKGAGSQDSVSEGLEQDGIELLRDIAKIQGVDINEDMIDWKEQDPHILLDDIAALTDTEDELEIARESFHDTEHEDTDLEAVYRKAQALAEIKMESNKEPAPELTLIESVHKKAQSLAGLDVEFFKEDRDKDPVIRHIHKKLQAMAGIKK